MSENDTMNIPWKDGIYRYKEFATSVVKIEGEKAKFMPVSCVNFEGSERSKGTIKYGNFGDAPLDIAEKYGITTYNVEISGWAGMKFNALLIDNGSRMVFKSFLGTNALEELIWMNNEEYEELLEAGDSVDKISCPYKIQPENKVTYWKGEKKLEKASK